MVNDVPLNQDPHDSANATILNGADLFDAFVESGDFAEWTVRLSNYLVVLQDRLFSSGLRYVVTDSSI